MYIDFVLENMNGIIIIIIFLFLVIIFIEEINKLNVDIIKIILSE